MRKPNNTIVFSLMFMCMYMCMYSFECVLHTQAPGTAGKASQRASAGHWRLLNAGQLLRCYTTQPVLTRLIARSLASTAPRRFPLSCRVDGAAERNTTSQ